jgi:hypothetical protein
MGRDDFVDEGQAQTQTGFFCGIEGVEDVMEIFRIDPTPCILYFDPYQRGAIL